MSKRRESASKGRRPVEKPVDEAAMAKSRPPPKLAPELDARGDAHGDLVRKFEGREVLQTLLTATGSLADAEDVAEVFRQAAEVEAPPAAVIQALWEDEPRFESPAQARRLFGNLLGLHDLIAAGTKVDLRPDAPPVRTKRVRAEQPKPFEQEPTEDFVEAAWRFFDDHPKDRERHQHAFDNRQDALLAWVDESGLSDEAFGLTTMLLSDLFAMLELGGMHIGLVRPQTIPALERVSAKTLPPALAQWVDEVVFEAQEDEQSPLSETEGEQVRALTSRAAAALWAACRK